jgi:hypothetical protein
MMLPIFLLPPRLSNGLPRLFRFVTRPQLLTRRSPLPMGRDISRSLPHVRRDHLRKDTCPDSLAHFCERLDTFEQKDLERRSAYRNMVNGESRV